MRKKWVIYVLTFSVALNAATATAFLLSWWHNQTLAAISLGQKPVKVFLQEDLNLTGEQSRQILGQIDRSKQEVAALRGLMDSKRAEMIGLIASTPANKDAVETKMEEVSRIQGQIRSAAVATVITILDTLPPEAKDKFRAYLQARGRACDVCCPPSPGAEKAVLDQ